MGRRKDQAQFNMRLSRPLLKQLQNAAKAQDRSLNSEMIHRLEQSFESGGQDRRDALAENTKAISALVEEVRALRSERSLLGLASSEPSDLAPPVPGLSPRLAATVLVAELGRPLTGNELSVAMEQPDSELGRLLRARLSPDNEPELPKRQRSQAKRGKS